MHSDTLQFACSTYLSSTNSSVFKRHKYSPKQTEKLKLRTLQRLAEQSGKLLDLSKFVSYERYILTKLDYKLRTPFRGQRYFRAVRQINRLMKKLAALSGDLRSNSLSDQIEIDNTDCSYCPDWVTIDRFICKLVQVIGLLNRICRYCELTAKYSGQQLQLEHFVAANLVLIGCVAVIHRSTIDLIGQLISSIDSLIGWRQTAILGVRKSKKLTKLCDENELCAAFSVEKPKQSVLDDLPDTAQNLTNFRAARDKCSNAEQKQPNMNFLGELFRMEQIDFHYEVKRVNAERETKRIVALKDQAMDLGVPVERSNVEANSNQTTQCLLDDLRHVSTLPHLKRFQAKLKSRAIELTDKVLLRKLTKSANIVKSRWSSLVVMKRSENDERLTHELESLKFELGQVLK